MKFKISTHGFAIDVSVIEQALKQVDPAAMIDLEKTSSSLRVSTCLDDAELLNLISTAGYPIPSKNLQGIPSDCCGGCSG